jgi:hypothetical protein
VAGPDEHAGTRAGDGAAFPSGRVGPGSALRGLDDVDRQAGREQDQRQNRPVGWTWATSSALYLYIRRRY